MITDFKTSIRGKGFRVSLRVDDGPWVHGVAATVKRAKVIALEKFDNEPKATRGNT